MVGGNPWRDAVSSSTPPSDTAGRGSEDAARPPVILVRERCSDLPKAPWWLIGEYVDHLAAGHTRPSVIDVRSADALNTDGDGPVVLHGEFPPQSP
jgi:hypothetical protein